jgi:hypothetical protein
MSAPATEQTMGLNYKRRVIHQALRQTFTDERSVRMYFDLWQDDYSSAHFVVTRFASVIAQHAGFDAEQKLQFQRRLYQGLTQAYEDLPRFPEGWIIQAHDDRLLKAPPAPKPVVNPVAPESSASQMPTTSETAGLAAPARAFAAQERFANAPAAAASMNASAVAVVFDTFTGHLIAAIMANTGGHRRILRDAVSHLTVGKNPREQSWFAAFQYWSDMRFQKSALHGELDDEQRRYCVRQLSVIVADLIGPAQADRLLVEAAARCESLPEGAVFSPANLL